MSTIRMRISPAGDVLDVKALIRHPMETGNREDKSTGEKIPANFIQKLMVSVNGEQVMDGNLSEAVSKNPYLNIKVPGKKGDEVTISWKSNTGESDEATQAA
ncbi:thiosulfate oxidation carrier complex protein SoxZ [Guyparkeria halophila]|uniref:Thiosulfate oxidation carrier complex protein SoxZ n=1 Tax=Guyparkeria halophila TaxID=47960 RepID=A0A6I6CT68_9GAMM|nr:MULTISPECIES: thiosulfate oxidation carrier complex protein SoxZ [Guyparkeria]QGT77646.1 thiosulfate oxidation carrier complex protein SoxZ [Guyparkeria halophila]TKA88477.1 thiosulfate oxidation carrier complex protein SoxZ [Guyparkeria sp. SB14A]